MKRIQRVFGDLDSLRYVDARLDEERRAAFLSHLADDPAETERVAIWTRQNEVIRAAFAGVALETLPLSLRLGQVSVPPRQPGAAPRDARLPVQLRTITSPELPPLGTDMAANGVSYLKDTIRPTAQPSFRAYRLTVGAAALVAIATLAVYIAHGLVPATAITVDPPAGRVDEAAALVSRASDAYATYALDPLRPVEVPASQALQLTHWIKRRLGVAVDLPDLLPEGWSLLGGRLVPGSSGPGAFFIYEDAAGERLSVFVQRAAPFPAKSVSLGSAAGDVAALTWVSGPLAYVVTVGKNLDWLSRNGEALRDRIGRPID